MTDVVVTGSLFLVLLWHSSELSARRQVHRLCELLRLYLANCTPLEFVLVEMMPNTEL